jgi:hypothetical protein
MSFAAKVQDVLSIILARLPCECRLPGIRSPPSPPLSAQEGELDGLLRDLDDPSWRDETGAVMPLAGPRTASAQYKRTGMHRRPDKRASLAAYAQESEPEEGMLEYDDDPSSVGRGTLDRLPELARRYEPTLTLEDMAREEREQEERDKREEMATKLGKRFANLPKTDMEDDFGGFAQAPEGGVRASIDPLGALPVPEEGNTVKSGEEGANAQESNEDDDGEAAEASFGLGNDESEDDD